MSKHLGAPDKYFENKKQNRAHARGADGVEVPIEVSNHHRSATELTPNSWQVGKQRNTNTLVGEGYEFPHVTMISCKGIRTL